MGEISPPLSGKRSRRKSIIRKMLVRETKKIRCNKGSTAYSTQIRVRMYCVGWVGGTKNWATTKSGRPNPPSLWRHSLNVNGDHWHLITCCSELLVCFHQLFESSQNTKLCSTYIKNSKQLKNTKSCGRGFSRIRQNRSGSQRSAKLILQDF